jgi:hypothetical protein
MTDPVQLVATATSVMLLVLVLELVRRKKLTEEYSFVWIVSALALIGLSTGRRLLDAIALALGIAYGPAILLLILIFFVFVASLSFSVVVSTHRKQIERLIEEAAILDARLRELSSRHETPAEHAGRS